jgi:hypothetical protein
MVDINQLASDYQRWQHDKKEYRRLRDLHYIQEKLREQQQTNDLTMTDIHETDTNKIKKRKKKAKLSTTSNETTSTTTTTTENK